MNLENWKNSEVFLLFLCPTFCLIFFRETEVVIVNNQAGQQSQFLSTSSRGLKQFSDIYNDYLARAQAARASTSTFLEPFELFEPFES